jgi:hypothetical protein
MIVVKSQAEPNLTLQFTAREAQIVEQAIFLVDSDTDFGNEADILGAEIRKALTVAGIDFLPPDTE